MNSHRLTLKPYPYPVLKGNVMTPTSVLVEGYRPSGNCEKLKLPGIGSYTVTSLVTCDDEKRVCVEWKLVCPDVPSKNDSRLSNCQLCSNVSCVSL